MNLRPKQETTRAGPDFGESRGAPDSRCIGPIVYGGANVRNDHEGELGNLGGVKIVGNELVAGGQNNKDIELMSDSDASVESSEYRSRSGSEASASASASGPGRFWQISGAKKPRLEGEGDGPPDEDMALVVKTKARGRPPGKTKKNNPGFFKNKSEFLEPHQNKRKNSEVSEEAEVRAAVVAQFHREQRLLEGSLTLSSEGGQQFTDLTAAQIKQNILDGVAKISHVADTSGRLNRAHVLDLRDAVTSIKEAVEALSSRTTSEETRLLQANNARLEAELSNLRKEVASLKMLFERNQRPETTQDINEEPPSTLRCPRKETSSATEREELHRSVMVQVGEMLNARLASLEDRLLPERRLRPPLATDKNKVPSRGVKTAVPATEDSPGPSRPVTEAQSPGTGTPKENQWEKVDNRKRRKKDKGAMQGDHPQTQGRSSSQSKPQPKSQSQPRKGKQPQPRKESHAEPKSAPASGQKHRKLRPPRSSAVVLTLQPLAEEKGVTYAKILAEAKQRISLSELGLTALRVKTAATGGRILELPGASCSDKADALAQKLREVIGDELLRVSRPVKCVDLRVSGLDDSIIPEDVMTAVAQMGGCPVHQVQCREITFGRTGLGTAWLRCPVGAAKKVLEQGRLLVGWVSAQVKVLDERPRRCFRCLELGHVRAKCANDVDRSSTCYRCGLVGHKARGCTATPHCIICAAAGRPSEHRGGGKACIQPKRAKKYSRKAGDGPRASSQSARPNPETRDEEVTMDEV